jgi:hypothetical protein
MYDASSTKTVTGVGPRAKRVSGMPCCYALRESSKKSIASAVYRFPVSGFLGGPATKRIKVPFES